MPTKITIVRDEEELQDLVERLRQNEEYEVGFCSLGPEAFKCIQENAPDLVVIDLRGPHAKGLNLMSVMMRDTSLSAKPIVLCTIPTPETEELLSQLAAMRLFVVQWPFAPDDIIAKIEEAKASQQDYSPPSDG